MNENDEMLLTDWLDGRLFAPESRAVEARLAAEPAFARHLAVIEAGRRALRGALSPAPADLKAALRRAARARTAADARPEWLEALRAAFRDGGWAYGAGAAFAAASVLAALWSALPPARPGDAPQSARAGWDPMSSLWTVEEGDDDDDI